MKFCISLLFALTTIAAFSQEREKIKVISRPVEGEIRTLYGDTLYGTIQVREAQDYYITSIFFKQKGKKKEILSAFDISKFRQIVPFPDRAEFKVEEVYFESQPDPSDPYKKIFMPLTEWK